MYIKLYIYTLIYYMCVTIYIYIYIVIKSFGLTYSFH